MNALDCVYCKCKSVCKYVELYKKANDAIMNTSINISEEDDGTVSFWRAKDCPHIKIEVRCPYRVF